jgi:nicotinamidase-related amidase
MITLASNVNSRLSALGESTVHLCIDMQRLFGSSGIWPTPWMERVLPIVAAVVNHCPERTVFTRFIPPRDPDEMPGMWQRYYRRWECATRDRVDPELIELHPALGKYTPPAAVIDKTRYSAFTEPLLSQFAVRLTSGTMH